MVRFAARVPLYHAQSAITANEMGPIDRGTKGTAGCRIEIGTVPAPYSIAVSVTLLIVYGN